MIVRVSVVLRRTVCDEIYWRFDNLNGSHIYGASGLQKVYVWTILVCNNWGIFCSLGCDVMQGFLHFGLEMYSEETKTMPRRPLLIHLFACFKLINGMSFFAFFQVHHDTLLPEWCWRRWGDCLPYGRQRHSWHGRKLLFVYKDKSTTQ